MGLYTFYIKKFVEVRGTFTIIGVCYIKECVLANYDFFISFSSIYTTT